MLTRVMLLIMSALAFVSSATADTVRLDDCSVSAFYSTTETVGDDGIVVNPLKEICHVWFVSTTCNYQVRFDYRVARANGEVGLSDGVVAKGQRKRFCGPKGARSSFFVE